MEEEPIKRSPVARICGAIGVALAALLGIYLLLDAMQPETGLVSFTFLLLLPAAVSAFISYVSDPWAIKALKFHLLVPVWLNIAVILVSAVVLREGVICIIILSPLWTVMGLLGSWITYLVRHRSNKQASNLHASAMLLLPLFALQVEPYIPLPQANATVSRSTTVNAKPAKIWPLLEGIPDVQAGEGRWNLSQDVIGIPRPEGADLKGSGIGAARYARWGNQIRFREVINQWQPGKRIGWRFIFDDIAGWAFTDRHLMPDSPYFRITTGGYSLAPLPDGRTRVTIETSYWMQTPVNGYSKLWGEFFLGDLENNLLALVKQRAERP